jgi:hypothetical protein
MTLQISGHGWPLLEKTWVEHPIFMRNGHCYDIIYMTDSADFDFRHHLRDTILLLGGKQEIADLLVKSLDGQINEADIEVLRDYNISLFGEAKSRLRNLNRLKLTVSPEP